MHKEALDFLAGLGGLGHGVNGSDPPQLAVALQSILDPLLGDVGMGEGNAQGEHDRRRRGRRHGSCFCIGITTAKTKINLEKPSLISGCTFLLFNFYQLFFILYSIFCYKITYRRTNHLLYLRLAKISLFLSPMDKRLLLCCKNNPN